MKTTKADRKSWREKYAHDVSYTEVMLLNACDDIEELEEKLKIAVEALQYIKRGVLSEEYLDFYVNADALRTHAREALAKIEGRG